MRRHSEELIVPLNPEDMTVQSIPDAGPARWHLAHPTWFFETFILAETLPGYRKFDPTYQYLFNSYYEALGPRQPRPKRGMITRPTVEEVLQYRRHVDAHMSTLLKSPVSADMDALLRLGLAHEEQHQELLLMDLLHLFSQSPQRTAYDPEWRTHLPGPRGRFRHVSGGLVDVGAVTSCVSFDNEGLGHPGWLQYIKIDDQ